MTDTVSVSLLDPMVWDDDPRRVAEAWAPALKALGDETRLTIVLDLARGPRNVKELQDVTGASQALVSHHLNWLRAHDLVVATPRGRSNVYALCCDELGRIVRCLASLAATTDEGVAAAAAEAGEIPCRAALTRKPSVMSTETHMATWTETARTFGTISLELVALFLGISFAVALLQRRLGPKRIQGWLGGSRAIGLGKGAALGAVTPFCSCSTIPMFVGMLKAGVPFGTSAAFLVGSPLLNAIILGAVGLLFGWTVAAAYAAVALVGTLVIAWAWQALGLARYLKRVRVVGTSEQDEGPWAGIRNEAPEAWRSAARDFRSLVIPMLAGVAVGAFIYGAVPQDFLVRIAGPGNPFAVPVAAVAGVPLYVRTEAALPIGVALTSAGMGVGPVFALIIGGAGASLPEVSMLNSLFRPPLLAAFLGSIFIVAVAGGLVIPALS